MPEKEKSVPPNDGSQIVTGPVSEDTPVTQLQSEVPSHSSPNVIDPRELDQMFSGMAGTTPGYASIPTGTVDFLPGIIRGLIRKFYRYL
jgi:hypothetical protein